MRKIHQKLLFCLILTVFFTFALWVNKSVEVSSGGFIGRILAFIDLNNYYGNYNLYTPSGNSPIFTGDLDSIASTLRGIVISTAILAQVANISPNQLVLIPIGLFLTAIGFYVVFYRIFESALAGLLGMIYTLIYCLSTGDQIGIYAAGWTFILLSLFMLCVILMLAEKNKSYLVISVILYIALLLYWHTAEAKGLFFVFGIAFAILLGNFLFRNHKQKLPLAFLSVILLLTFTFETIIANSFYFSQLRLDRIFLVYYGWLSSILNRISTSGTNDLLPTDAGTFYYMPSGVDYLTRISTYSSMILILIIMAPIIISCLADLSKILSHSKRDRAYDNKFIIKWALLITQVIFTVAYGLSGGAGPGIIFAFFPIASLIALNDFKGSFQVKFLNKHATTLFFVLIIILSVSYYGSYIYKTATGSAISYGESEVASAWLAENMENQGSYTSSVLTDFITAGKMLDSIAGEGLILNYQTYRPYIYQSLIEKEEKIRAYCDVVIINNRALDSPVQISQGWTPLVPLSPYMASINENNRLDLMYSDGYVSMYKT